ncbi:MAG TPA: XdhC family protein [Rhizomicrobium sp.]|jgi:xanthine/CO dehydrogenase XdhC/CoxF family maturation factor|nr:XdhC family protein [Rhizomicrobium sp.]
MTDEELLFETVERWRGQGRGVALATVVKTWGSAPRPAGSHMAVRDDGAFVGSISGGCVEGATIDAAAQTIGDGQTRQLHFGVSDETAWSVGLACGGHIDVFVERVE